MALIAPETPLGMREILAAKLAEAIDKPEMPAGLRCRRRIRNVPCRAGAVAPSIRRRGVVAHTRTKLTSTTATVANITSMKYAPPSRQYLTTDIGQPWA